MPLSFSFVQGGPFIPGLTVSLIRLRLSPQIPSTPSRQSFQARRPVSHLQNPLPPTLTLLPVRFTLPLQHKQNQTKKSGWALRLTRRRCEDGLLLLTVGWGTWTLGWQWNEKALAAGEHQICGKLVDVTQRLAYSSVFLRCIQRSGSIQCPEVHPPRSRISGRSRQTWAQHMPETVRLVVRPADRYHFLPIFSMRKVFMA